MIIVKSYLSVCVLINLPAYYLDIETTGLDAVADEIITIQWAELERGTGKIIGDIHILKSWESDEKTILEKFSLESGIQSSCRFDFIPFVFSLQFEHRFLLSKSTKYDLTPIDILHKPHVDMQSLAVLMNEGEFLGSGLDKITHKPSSGSMIPEYYEKNQYNKIEQYIITEAKQFSYFTEWAHQELHKMRKSLEEYIEHREKDVNNL